MPSRTPLAALAVARTVVRPIVATTAPWDCWASLPVSNERVRSVPLIGAATRMASAIGNSFMARGHAGADWSGGASSQSAAPRSGPETGPRNRRLTTAAPTAHGGTGQNGRCARLAAQTVLQEDRAVALDVDALDVIE